MDLVLKIFSSLIAIAIGTPLAIIAVLGWLLWNLCSYLFTLIREKKEISNEKQEAAPVEKQEIALALVPVEESENLPPEDQSFLMEDIPLSEPPPELDIPLDAVMFDDYNPALEAGVDQEMVAGSAEKPTPLPEQKEEPAKVSKPKSNRSARATYTGKLVESGWKQNGFGNRQFCVSIIKDNGEPKDIWGNDLNRCMREGQYSAGSRIKVSLMGSDEVPVMDPNAAAGDVQIKKKFLWEVQLA